MSANVLHVLHILGAVQMTLGVVKILMGLTIGRKRMVWHLTSGAVIVILAVPMLVMS